jgi:hypothetical protein
VRIDHADAISAVEDYVAADECSFVSFDFFDPLRAESGRIATKTSDGLP